MDPAQTALAAGVTTFFHPLAYVKTLIQIGYEPFPPVQTTSLIGKKKILVYPNVLQYLGHIRRTEGFFGMYRGLTPRLLSNVVGSVVSNVVSAELVGQPVGVPPSDRDTECEKNVVAGVNKLVKDTVYESIARSAGLLASQPFYVITIRSMSQVVGRETKYSGIFSSISEIWNNEGILGFFAGLMPRLIGELLTIWLANILTHVINNMLLPASKENEQKDRNRNYSTTFSQLVVTQLTYPFLVVSSVMAITDSGLLAASLPPSVRYTSWRDCWSRLASMGQLKRGSGMFWRVYKGPSRIGFNGELVPVMEAL